MAQIIRLRRSSVSGQKPTNSNLELGELALNTTDGKAFMSKSGSLGPSIEELIITNASNTGSINLSGSIKLDGVQTITGSLIVTDGLGYIDTGLIAQNSDLLLTSGSNIYVQDGGIVSASQIWGDGSHLFNIPASGVTGLELNKIINGNVSASILNDGTFRVNGNTYINDNLIVNSNVSASYFTGSFKGNGSQLYNIPISGVTNLENVTSSIVNRLGFLETESGSIRSNFNTFTSSYTTGSFTGSFIGNGVNLTNVNATTLDSKDSTEFATTGSNIFIGNQVVTGSLITTGSNKLIGDTQLTGSLTISGSTVQIGNNTLFGTTLLSGSLVISGSQNTPSDPTIKILGDIQTDGAIKLLPVNRNINTSLSGSYIYVSGSTDDLYFSQNSKGYNNVTRLRWLEGNLYTGLLNGGLISATPGGTTFNIGAGSGIIVNLNGSLTDNPYPTVKYVNWNAHTGQTLTYIASNVQTFVGIDENGQVTQQIQAFNNGTYNTQITLGTVLHQNLTTVNATITYPNLAYGYKQRTYDFIKAFGPLKLSGLGIITAGTQSLNVGSGTAFADGRNYQNDPNNPSYITDSGTTVSKIFRYHQVSGTTYVQDTNNASGYTTLDVANYNDNGTITAVPGTGSNRRWSLQRIFWYPNSATKGIVAYYGNSTYASSTEAAANLPYEPFFEIENTRQNAVYLGAIALRNDAVWSDSTSYLLLPGGTFRNVGGSGGGGNVPSNRFTDLIDVDVANATNGDLPIYNGLTTLWEHGKKLTGDYQITGSLLTTGTIVSQTTPLVSGSSQIVISNTTGFGNFNTEISSSISSSVNDLSGSVAITTLNNKNDFNLFTSSYTTGSFTGSFKGDASQLYNIPLSGITNLELDKIVNGNVSASISPANGFRVNTDATIDGDLNVNGIITAKEIHVDFVTSSVLYESGSTRFGDTFDDNHSFTGSVKITGSLTLNNDSVVVNTDFNNYTTSVDDRLDLIEISTSSLNSFTSSINTTIKDKLNSENVISGSIQIELTGTTGYNTFSSSISSSIGELSGSIALTINELSGSISSSIGELSSSISLSINELSGSVSSSIGELSGSVATTTLTIEGRLDDIETSTGSLNTFTSSYTTGSFTGSFVGDGSGLTGVGQIETVYYVSEDGNDLNDGKTLTTSFRTIKAATLAASSSLALNPGLPVFRQSIHVKTGYYIEDAPITVPSNVSILGDDLRTVVVRPSELTKTSNLFLMNNGTYCWGLRLEGCIIDDLENPRNGFFFAFAPNAYIVTSPYVQNCSAINTPVDKFYSPLDLDTGNPLVGNGPGGLIVDDSVLNGYSPLKSMIVDAYTQVAFNGIGICVRGRGYAQLVSFFTNFSRVGTYCIDGGHASLLNSNTTFGDYGLRSKGLRILVKPNTTSVTPYLSSADSLLISNNKVAIQNYMIAQLIALGNFSSEYSNTGSTTYQSTIRDSGLLIDSIADDLLSIRAARTTQFTQGLFKGQDTSVGSIYTLPATTGFTQGAIAVFPVTGTTIAEDFIDSYTYIKDYIVNDPDNIFTGMTASGTTKVSQLLDVPINTLTSVVINNAGGELLEEFGSLITSTSHDFSYAGAGVNFLALPPNQGGVGETNVSIRIFEEGGGRVYHTSGDETGDFYAGNDFIIRQGTGTIEGRTFTKALSAQFTPLNLALES